MILRYTNSGFNPYAYYMNAPYSPYEDNSMGEYLDMSEAQLEEMYPTIYRTVYPSVSYRCDRMHAQHGDMYVPNREEFDEMVSDIQNNVIENEENSQSQEVDINQWNRNSGPFRDLVSILLIRELLDRRRFPHDRNRGRRRDRYDRYGRGPGYWY